MMVDGGVVAIVDSDPELADSVWSLLGCSARSISIYIDRGQTEPYCLQLVDGHWCPPRLDVQTEASPFQGPEVGAISRNCGTYFGYLSIASIFGLLQGGSVLHKRTQSCGSLLVTPLHRVAGALFDKDSQPQKTSKWYGIEEVGHLIIP